ncbi:hypothetical protein TX24_24575 [Pseudomonas lactis]|nr:hypothetical protein TX24_24575 [Pseudomonas lactis]
MVLAQHLQLARAIREASRDLRKVLISKFSSSGRKFKLKAVRVPKIPVPVPVVPVALKGREALRVPMAPKALVGMRVLKSCSKNW